MANKALKIRDFFCRHKAGGRLANKKRENQESLNSLVFQLPSLSTHTPASEKLLLFEQSCHPSRLLIASGTRGNSLSLLLLGNATAANFSRSRLISYFRVKIDKSHVLSLARCQATNTGRG